MNHQKSLVNPSASSQKPKSTYLDKVFKQVTKIHNRLDWDSIFQQLKSDGYDDIHQAQFVRVSDLVTQYGLDGKGAIYLYFEIQNEYRKQFSPNAPFFPTKDEIESISLESLNNLYKQPAEIRFQSSKNNNLPLNLNILFGPQNIGKTSFISAFINSIRGIKYHSLLRYKVQKNEKIIKIDDGNEQFCFLKAQTITNPYDNREIATNLIQFLEQELSRGKLQSFSILYFTLATQTTIGQVQKYEVQKILELIPYNMRNFFVIKTFCTDDNANMVIFTGKHSPAYKKPEFIEKYINYENTSNQNYQKYIFNNKIFSYDYKSNRQVQAQNQQMQQEELEHSYKINQEQSSIQSINFSLDDLDIPHIYWQRNETNLQILRVDQQQLDSTTSEFEYNQFKTHLRNLVKIEKTLQSLSRIKEEIKYQQNILREKMQMLQNVKSQIQTTYITMQSQKVAELRKKKSDDEIKALSCTQCDKICYLNCLSIQLNQIQDCNRFKKGFCKSCYKDKQQICTPNKHTLNPDEQNYCQVVEVKVIMLDTNLFKMKNQQKQKDELINQVRFKQMEIFKLKKGYFEQLKQFHLVCETNNRYGINGYLSINFEIYKKVLEQLNLDHVSVYLSAINDLFRQ